VIQSYNSIFPNCGTFFNIENIFVPVLLENILNSIRQRKKNAFLRFAMLNPYFFMAGKAGIACLLPEFII